VKIVTGFRNDGQYESNTARCYLAHGEFINDKTLLTCDRDFQKISFHADLASAINNFLKDCYSQPVEALEALEADIEKKIGTIANLNGAKYQLYCRNTWILLFSNATKGNMPKVMDRLEKLNLNIIMNTTRAIYFNR
jgi:hypothetical protein